MNILIVSDAPLSKNNSVGNTYSNWFSGMAGIKIASIYTRASLPVDGFCDSYYQVHAGMIAKNWLHPQRIGRIMQQKELCTDSFTGERAEKKLIRWIKRFRVQVAYDLEDFLFESKKWENQKFESFVKDFQPDIVMAFIRSSVRGDVILSSVQELVPTCKFVGFIADDIYGVVERKRGRRARKARKIIVRLMKHADRIYGVSQEICDAYANLFDVDITPLYKGCTFEEIPDKSGRNDIRIVYAGNLLYGRGETLGKLAETIARHNASSTKNIKLEIYTVTAITTKLEKTLNVPGASRICGAKSYDEIREIMKDADVALHVESFDPSMISTVRYSFSTKIIDCLQSGAVMMAIGPKGISSIEYPRQIPGAIVIDQLENLKKTINQVSLLDLSECATETRKFAKEHHSIDATQSKLKSDLEALLHCLAEMRT